MNTETRKIAVACFIGGMVCAGLALAVAPALWWLGLIAGFAAGYVAYEFRVVIHAVPVAYRRTQERLKKDFEETREGVRSFFAQPRPFFFGGVIIGAVFYYMFAWFISESNEIPGLGSFIFANVFFIAFGFTAGVCSSVLLLMFAVLGMSELERDGTDLNTLQTTSYGNALRLVGRGALMFIVVLAQGVRGLLVRFVRASHMFVYELFRIIHSDKRLLCGIDGALGGAIAYLALGSFAPSAGGKVLVVVSGGLIGAALGIANWEIVSKRILRVTQK